jgi:hypothetical protein
MDRAKPWPWLCAATAVRTLALVAANMPRKPASADDTAPAMKAIAVFVPRGETKMPSSSTAANMASILYSRCMKTMAPRWIWSPMCFTSPSPWLWRISMW